METVSATDPDEGGNGQFRYSIESGDPDDQFAIDGMNASSTNQQQQQQLLIALIITFTGIKKQ